MGKKGIWLNLKVKNEKLKPKEIVVLADSGSSWSLCSDRLRNYAVDIRPIPPEVKLVSATNGAIKGTGIGLFELQFGDLTILTDIFLVDTEMSWPYTIIGLTLLEQLNALIDLKNKTLTIKNDGNTETIPYHNYANHHKSKRVSIITPIYQIPTLLDDDDYENYLLNGPIEGLSSVRAINPEAFSSTPPNPLVPVGKSKPPNF